MTAKITILVSVLLLPISASFWHRSHSKPWQHRWDVTLYKSLWVYVRNGICAMELVAMPTRTPSRSQFDSKLSRELGPPGQTFVFKAQKRPGYWQTWLVFPLWLPTGFLAVIGTSATVIGPFRRWNRRRRGRCVDCGYDLRGSRFGRCPECGLEFDRPKTSRPRAGRAATHKPKI